MNNSNKFQATEKSTKVDGELILRSLRKGPKAPADIISDQKLSKKDSTNLAYHLSKLQKENIIERTPGAIYQIIETPENSLDGKFLSILELDNCRGKKFEEINNMLELEGIKISKTEILESLKNLEHRWKVYEDNGLFAIPNHQLNEHNRCVVCKKTLEDDQLIISEFTLDDSNSFVSNLLHATCRPSQLNSWVENYTTNCDYCGLSLNAAMLGQQENNKINIDAEIDTLFNEPFSKIFSTISAKDYMSSIADEHVSGYAHFKRKDGKQYHPYCFDIIQESKKEPKK
jgi:hypothetical protein